MAMPKRYDLTIFTVGPLGRDEDMWTLDLTDAEYAAFVKTLEAGVAAGRLESFHLEEFKLNTVEAVLAFYKL